MRAPDARDVAKIRRGLDDVCTQFVECLDRAGAFASRRAN